MRAGRAVRRGGWPALPAGAGWPLGLVGPIDIAVHVKGEVALTADVGGHEERLVAGGAADVDRLGYFGPLVEGVAVQAEETVRVVVAAEHVEVDQRRCVR